MSRTELVYHNGHYHRVPAESQGRNRGGRPMNVWRTTYELWDGVLYGVGSVYDKLRGR